MTTKKATYDAYKGARKMANAARALLDLLRTVEENTSMHIQSADYCPRCRAHLKEIRIDPHFIRLMVYCVECHYFVVYDRLGRIKSFAEDNKDNRPLTLLPPPSPRRPLERLIHNHMENIKKDNKV